MATALAALVIATVAACGSDDPANPADGRTVTTAYGDVVVPDAPQRVAAVSFDTPWQLRSLDVTPVAALDYKRYLADYPKDQQEFITDIPSIGTYGELNFEAVAASKPDLIVGDSGEIDEAAYRRLSAIAPTVIVGSKTRGDWQSITEQTAQAVGRTDRWAAAKKSFEDTRDRLRRQYAGVIDGNRWVHFSLGDDAAQFSVQQPTGATGNLVVNELGMAYGPNVPTTYSADGYGSYPLEKLGTVFDGVTAALTFEQADGTPNPAIKAIEDNELFRRIEVAKTGRVFRLGTTVTDYVTALTWLAEVEKKVFAVL